MHLLIEGLGARVGGGITRLRGLLDALTDACPEHRYSVLLSTRYQQDLIDRVPPGVGVVATAVRANLLERAWFQNMHISEIALEIGADAIFAASEGAYFRSNLPLVMMCGNLLLFDTERNRNGGRYAVLRRPVLRGSFKTASKIAFVSNAIRDVALRQLHLDPEAAFVIHHGVDPMFTARSAEATTPYYLAVSTITDHKGYETLVDAWRMVDETVPGVRIAGGTGDVATYERIVNAIVDLGLQHRVKLEGRVAHDDLPRLYGGARALVFPSEVESFGLPLLEAMASGVPVIASDLPVCREVCGDAALYFSPRDSEALARRIELFEGDVHLRKRMAAAGLERAKLFTWSSAATTLMSNIEDLLARKR